MNFGFLDGVKVQENLIQLNLLQAVKYIEYDSSFSDEEKKQAKALKISCNLNTAACKLKLKEYKQAEKLCTKVMCGLLACTCIDCKLYGLYF